MGLPDIDPGSNDHLPDKDGPYDEHQRKPIWWYHTDHLGSSTYLTDNFGRPSHYYETLPFGEMMVEHNQSTYNGGQYNNVYKFNGKELDDATGMYYYGARYYDPRISIFISVDPLAEQTMEPYLYTGNNPIMFTDPTGMSKEDNFVFNENGDFVRIDKTDQPDRIVVENSQTGSTKNYWFADPKEDPKQIRDGTINKLIFVSKNKIKDMLSNQGAFEPDNKDNWTSFYKQSKGGQNYDYSYSVIPNEFASQGASYNPLDSPSPMLFVPEGDYMAHNHMNFGNYLWAASGFTLGFSYTTLQLAAHGNSLLNSGSNGYRSQLDSDDDQSSIIKGAYYSEKNNFRQILQKAIDTKKSQKRK